MNENLEGLDDLPDIFDRLDQAHQLAEMFHADRKLRSRFLAVTYRCHVKNRRGERCVLAYIYNTPHGIIVHHPAYKLSPELNAQSSSAEGRAVNTLDGNNHWKPRTYFLSQAINLTMECRHARQEVVDRDDVVAAVKANRRSIVVTPTNR